MLDPGLSAGDDNAAMKLQVPDGRGGTTDCQAAGAATLDGFPEHALAWEVALLVRAVLEARGVRTALTRGNDNAMAACVDERAAMANALPSPNAIVSIHAYAANSSQRGFIVSYPSLGLNGADTEKGVELARAVRDQLVAAGIATAEDAGTDGLAARSDLAELNLAEYPAVQVALGNMNNNTDAEMMQTAEGGSSTPTRSPKA
jgi:N-acetylmuramoyl-L-alanine amidase